MIDEEREYFVEWARRYPENRKVEKYEILPWEAKPDMSNMIYASDPKSLRIKHLEYIATNPNGGGTGYQVRKHIDWIEKLEGKQ